MVTVRRLVWVVVLCCVLFGPGVAAAQQLPIIDGRHLAPTLDSPTLFVGWSPNVSFISLAATGTANDGFDAAWGDGKLLWSANGLWLGIGLPASLGDRFGVLAEGWVLVPGNSTVEGWGRGFSTNDSPGSVAGNLDINTTWFAIDLGGSYRVTESTWVIGGARYDHVEGTMKAPGPLERLIFQNYGPVRTTLDVNLNSVFPYVGLSCQIGSRSQSVSATVKGFPAAISVADAHPKRGYFAELSIEGTASPSEYLTLSVFGRVDVAYAVFEEFSDIANIFGVDPNRPATASLEQALSVNWQQFIIGGKIGLNFWSPLL